MPLDSPYLDAIRRFEGFNPKPYWDYRQWTSGFGTRASGPGETIDRTEADRRLQGELGNAQNRVRGLGVSMTPGQEAALTSLTFNAGPSWMNSGLGQAVRSGDWNTARQRFLQYVNAGGQPLAGLRSRRAEEAGWLAQPTQTASTGATAMPTRNAGLSAWLFPAANAAEEPLLPFPLPPMPQGQQAPQLPMLGPQQPLPGARPNMPPTLMQEAGPMQPPPGPPSMAPGLLPVPPAAPSAPMGVPQFPQGNVQPAESPTIEAPFPTPPDPGAIMSGATAAHAQNNPPQRGFFDKLEGGLSSPLAAAGLQLLFPQSNLSNAMQGAMRAQREQGEYQRQTSQRALMDRIWSEAFPNGQPNMQHPLLQGTSPQVAAMMHTLGPETALPLLARSRMAAGKWEVKDGVMYNEALGPSSAVQLPGGGKPPAGFRWAEGGQQLEPIPGGPGEHIAADMAGRLAVMHTAKPGLQAARQFFTRNWSPGEAARNAVGGAVVAPEYDQHRRTVRLGVEGVLRAMTGAAAPPAEVDQYMELFMPKVTDPPAIAKQKLDLLEQFMSNAEEVVTRGRRAAGSNPAAPSNDGFSIRRLQ